ncbi:hypothetical protein VOLCADRAFT_102723 [Volvox carteri f. nagariensis]|uniref:Uncharacterized protein n=1 Tax=Volvox carteri f. nagariensis TaxID=3068 RepID=D8THN7_VOLCA|nr:uncharacterized protein VOLCADRAFT_102723 [Volvox carteri f. nagariensis]EFJ52747.1 hypothetical protein VOLCADRAFT_102723 [Volvox carteri f. nagariensis]|eukprot:XP_002945752.1 hypothetical protein VOLCADRAFT_102723 [Volvox carteri f. nagariensis]
MDPESMLDHFAAVDKSKNEPENEPESKRSQRGIVSLGGFRINPGKDRDKNTRFLDRMKLDAPPCQWTVKDLDHDNQRGLPVPFNNVRCAAAVPSYSPIAGPSEPASHLLASQETSITGEPKKHQKPPLVNLELFNAHIYLPLGPSNQQPPKT